MRLASGSDGYPFWRCCCNVLAFMEGQVGSSCVHGWEPVVHLHMVCTGGLCDGICFSMALGSSFALLFRHTVR